MHASSDSLCCSPPVEGSGAKLSPRVPTLKDITSLRPAAGLWWFAGHLPCCQSPTDSAAPRKGLVQPEAANADGPTARGGVGSRRGREAGVKTPAFLPLLLLGSSQTALAKFLLPCLSLSCSMLFLPRCHQSIICPSEPWPRRSHPLPALGCSHQRWLSRGLPVFLSERPVHGMSLLRTVCHSL